MLEHLKKYDIVLGSASPRRKELFSLLNIPFRVDVKEVDESNISPMGLGTAKYLAQIKADVHGDLNDNKLLITADTIVWFEGRIYGKPADRDEAIKILSRLSNETHLVVTGVCLKTKEKQELFNSITEVEFAKISKQEIEYYVDTFQPYDKAGAYGIQEWIGDIGVKKISGSYHNVMGLPLQKIYKKLKKW